MTFAVFPFFAAMKAPAADAVSWSYSGATGPEHWGELAPQYALCADGREQSPINLTDFTAANLAPIRFDYTTAATEILNNGHAVDIRFAPGSRIEVNGQVYTLLGLHFHVPAEHRIENKSYALEAHFVNADENGNLAVVGVLYSTGDANAALAKIASLLPNKPGERKSLAGKFTAADFLPHNHDYYFYNGSLTTPPCSEGVSWFVLKTPLSASKPQVQAFLNAVGSPNNRPLQARNGRSIQASRIKN